MVLPIFAAEMAIYPSWLIRNFWILYAIAFGTCHLLNTVEYYLDGGTSIITGHWLAGLAVVGISLANYVLKSGETIETPVHSAGVYIVNKKKLFVK